MNRNLSITEFINSFTFGKTLYPNTLKYLYNADSQNGLYICKAPKNSGTNTFINLLTLYRIANLVIDPTASNFGSALFTYHIYWHTWQASLAMNAINSLLEQSTLFAKTSSEDLQARSVLDKLHVYYCYEEPTVIKFAGVKLIFTNLMEPDSLGRIIETPTYKCQGIVYELYEGGSPAGEKDDPFYDWFENLLTNKVYAHPDFRLSKSSNNKVPFCIINSSKIFKRAPLKFNNIDTIEFTAPPFCKDLNNQCNELEDSLEIRAYLKCHDLEYYNFETEGTKPCNKTALCPPRFELNGDCEEVLKDEFGLYKDWDYGPYKTESCTEESNLSKLERFTKKGKKYAQLISNQTAYMNNFLRDKTKLEQRDIFKKLSDTLQVTLKSPEDVIDHIIDTFESPLECTLTASFDPDNAPTGWKALETGRSVIQEDGKELCPKELPTLYCDREVLMKAINETLEELLILIPVKLDTGLVYGIWRKNLLSKYYNNVLV